MANRLAARVTTHVFTAAPGVRLAHATALGIPLRHITGPQHAVQVPDGDHADPP